MTNSFNIYFNAVSLSLCTGFLFLLAIILITFKEKVSIELRTIYYLLIITLTSLSGVFLTELIQAQFFTRVMSYGVLVILLIVDIVKVLQYFVSLKNLGTES